MIIIRFDFRICFFALLTESGTRRRRNWLGSLALEKRKEAHFWRLHDGSRRTRNQFIMSKQQPSNKKNDFFTPIEEEIAHQETCRHHPIKKKKNNNDVRLLCFGFLSYTEKARIKVKDEPTLQLRLDAITAIMSLQKENKSKKKKNKSNHLHIHSPLSPCWPTQEWH